MDDETRRVSQHRGQHSKPTRGIDDLGDGHCHCIGRPGRPRGDLRDEHLARPNAGGTCTGDTPLPSGAATCIVSPARMLSGTVMLTEFIVGAVGGADTGMPTAGTAVIGAGCPS